MGTYEHGRLHKPQLILLQGHDSDNELDGISVCT